MDHIRISGTEPSSVILSQKSSFKIWKVLSQKCLNKLKPKGMVYNPQNYNPNQIEHGEFRCSQNATNKPKSTVELGYMCPRGLTGPPAVTLFK